MVRGTAHYQGARAASILARARFGLDIDAKGAGESAIGFSRVGPRGLV
jgi:hypothetical protein